MNRKILLISFNYPPRPGIGGNRIFGLAKYLPQFGFEPIVFTGKLPRPHDSDCLVIESNFYDKILTFKKIGGYSNDRSIYDENLLLKVLIKEKSNFLIKLVNLVKFLALFPDRYSSWYKNAVKDIDNYLINNEVDGIISSLNPIISHKIARHVKMKKDVVWIADYRDLWSNNHYLNVFQIQRKLMYLYEKHIIKSADYLVTVSQPLANDLINLHKKPVRAILNGFDPNLIVKSKLNEKFTIVYTGQLYKGKRDPTLLFEAIRNAIDENLINKSEISVNFYGPFSDWLKNLIHKFQFEECVNQMGFIEKSQAIQKQCQAQLLLLLNWDNESDIGNYTGKIFEYFAAKRPIISIGREDSVVSKLITETRTGIASNRLEKIKYYLVKCYQEYRSCGSVTYIGNDLLDNYSQIRMAEQFSLLLNKI